MQCFCIYKVRGRNGRIVGYQFTDGRGDEFRLDAETTKRRIVNGSLEPINLKLTSDGKLIYYKTEVENSYEELSARVRRYLVEISTRCNIAFKRFYDIGAAISKAKMLGKTVEQFRRIYVISDNKNILVASDCGIRLPVDCFAMFQSLVADKVSLHGLNGENVLSFRKAFEGCSINTLDLSGIYGCQPKDLSCMFHNSNIKNIVFGDFDTSAVGSMSEMFEGFEGDKLSLTGLDTRNCQAMDSMFEECSLEELDIRINANSVKNMNKMFFRADIPFIDLSSFSPNIACEMEIMFGCCDAKIRANDKRIIQKYNTRNTLIP